MKKRLLYFLLIGAVFSACENQPWEFPDYNYSAAYFAYQSPVRSIVLGTDYTYDNTLDNEHRCRIMATVGGMYENKSDIRIDVEVDNSLCNNLIFGADSAPAIAMPSNYYALPADMQIVIPAGKLIGGIDVQLTDAFFNDPLSVRNAYVIPLVMRSVANADSILSGNPLSDTADRRIAGEWKVAPKDYILFAVKYINQYDANYLRRGVEAINGTVTNVYREEYVEQDLVCKANSVSMNSVSISLEALNADETKTPFDIILNFDSSNNCTVQNPEGATYTITGSGKYVVDGDAWGGKSRNVLHLNYAVDFGAATHSYTDTLVLRDRGVSMELFTPVVTQ